MKIQEIISQPTSLWFQGCWDQKGGVSYLVRHFWVQKKKVISNSQDGFTIQVMSDQPRCWL